MYYLIEEMANQREREIVARTRSPLFTHHPATVDVRRGLPALSWGKWRHWATRPDVYCSRAAATAGAC